MKGATGEPAVQVCAPGRPAEGKDGIRSSATVQEKVSVAASPSASVAVTVAAPPGGVAEAGVPDTSRDAASNVTPAGRPVAA